jgi:hypothetical protein
MKEKETVEIDTDPHPAQHWPVSMGLLAEQTVPKNALLAYLSTRSVQVDMVHTNEGSILHLDTMTHTDKVEVETGRYNPLEECTVEEEGNTNLLRYGDRERCERMLASCQPLKDCQLHPGCRR